MDEKSRAVTPGHQPQYYSRRPITRPARNIDGIRPASALKPVAKLPQAPQAQFQSSGPAPNIMPVGHHPTFTQTKLPDDVRPVQPSSPATLDQRPSSDATDPTISEDDYSSILEEASASVNSQAAPIISTTPQSQSQPASKSDDIGKVAGQLEMHKASAVKPVKKSKKIKSLVSIFVIVVVLGVGYAVFSHFNNSATKATPAQIRAAAAAQLLDKTAQYKDASKIGSGIGIYEASNQNTLPKTLGPATNSRTIELCGTSCATSTETVAVGPLAKYVAAEISFKAYSATLVAPNVHILYIVPNATCDNEKQNLLSGNSTGSVALLYAIPNSSGYVQECLEV
jgi:hypothetical protein